MPRAELSSKALATIAGRILSGGAYVKADVYALAGSVLTQAANKPAPAKPAKKKR